MRRQHVPYLTAWTTARSVRTWHNHVIVVSRVYMYSREGKATETTSTQITQKADRPRATTFVKCWRSDRWWEWKQKPRRARV